MLGNVVRPLVVRPRLNISPISANSMASSTGTILVHEHFNLHSVPGSNITNVVQYCFIMSSVGLKNELAAIMVSISSVNTSVNLS